MPRKPPSIAQRASLGAFKSLSTDRARVPKARYEFAGTEAAVHLIMLMDGEQHPLAARLTAREINKRLPPTLRRSDAEIRHFMRRIRALDNRRD